MRKCILNTLVLTLLMIGIIFIPTFASDISEQIARTRTYIEIKGNNNSRVNHDIESVTFGRYKYANSETPEPLEWVVLDKKDGKALLITKYILLDKEFESVRRLTNKSQEILAEGTTWGLSSLRSWLNNDFYNETFSNDERGLILTTKNKNESLYSTDEDYDDTEDKVFLLSVEEGTIYSTMDGFNDFMEWKKNPWYSFNGNISLNVAPLNMGHRKTCKEGCTKDHPTWTRTMGKKKERSYNGIEEICVRAYAGFDWRTYSDAMADYKAGVRPAMWVKYDGPASSITIADVSANSTGNAKSISNNVQENTKPASKNGWVGDYYYQNDVVVKNTWVSYGNDMYYCGSTGAILKNQWIDNTYYVDNTGKMLKNTTTPDGYKVGADGKYIAETKSTQNQNVANNSNLASQVAKAKCVTEYSKDTTVEQMDTVTFGSYPQSDVSGNTKEPIEWIVLEKSNNEVLLLSKYILDCKRYNEELKDVTWETCTLRQWFNNTFYNIAFSNDEKKSIIKSYVENKNNSDFGTSGGNSTNDYVYSLSIDECRKYFGDEDENDFNKRLATKGTEYAKSVDNDGDRLYVSDVVELYGGNSYFCLRSPGRLQSASTYVGDDGIVFTSGGGVDDGGTGLRPLIRVKYK